MWQGASELKRAAARRLRRDGRPGGAGADRGFERLAQLQEETGRVLVHPFDDPLVIAGQGTVGRRDRARTCPRSTSSSCPVGGGGLVSGIAVGAGPRPAVVAVEPEGSRRVPRRPRGRRAGPGRRRARSPTASTRRSRARSRCRSAASSAIESVLVTEEEIEARLPLPLRAREARRGARPGRPGWPRCSPGRSPDVEGATVAVVVSGGNVAAETASGILKPDRARPT